MKTKSKVGIVAAASVLFLMVVCACFLCYRASRAISVSEKANTHKHDPSFDEILNPDLRRDAFRKLEERSRLVEGTYAVQFFAQVYESVIKYPEIYYRAIEGGDNNPAILVDFGMKSGPAAYEEWYGKDGWRQYNGTVFQRLSASGATNKSILSLWNPTRDFEMYAEPLPSPGGGGS